MDLKVLVGILYCAMICAGQAEENKHDSSDSELAAEDDSDMYMEPLEEDHQSASSSIQEQAPVAAESGQWFPSFEDVLKPFEHPPSGHSRPSFFSGYEQQEGAYSQRHDPPYQQDVTYREKPAYVGIRTIDVKEASQPRPVKDKSASILGDGNFGVIQGGTFYAEKAAYEADGPGFEDFSSYFHNGHGRPSYFSPSKKKPAKQQQFENFRDFADINSPPERQYSQYVVVYTNKNGTRTSTVPSTPLASEVDPEDSPSSVDDVRPIQIDVNRPKNILESLELLDRAEASVSDAKEKNDDDVMFLTRTLLLPSYDQGDMIEIPPEKKLSKSKRKLQKLVPEKKHEARLLQKANDMREPLLALS